MSVTLNNSLIRNRTTVEGDSGSALQEGTCWSSEQTEILSSLRLQAGRAAATGHPVIITELWFVLRTSLRASTPQSG